MPRDGASIPLFQEVRTEIRLPSVVHRHVPQRCLRYDWVRADVLPTLLPPLEIVLATTGRAQFCRAYAVPTRTRCSMRTPLSGARNAAAYASPLRHAHAQCLDNWGSRASVPATNSATVQAASLPQWPHAHRDRRQSAYSHPSSKKEHPYSQKYNTLLLLSMNIVEWTKGEKEEYNAAILKAFLERT